MCIRDRHELTEKIRLVVSSTAKAKVTEAGVSYSQHRKKLGEVLKKNAGEWTGRVEISKEVIPGSKHSMYG